MFRYLALDFDFRHLHLNILLPAASYKTSYKTMRSAKSSLQDAAHTHKTE